MNEILHGMESVVFVVAEAGIHLMELSGIVIMLITAVKGLIGYFRRTADVRLKLAQGIALALEFKMGGEVLRTVIARDWKDLGILGAVIALRAALTLLIHWEIRNEERHADGTVKLR